MRFVGTYIRLFGLLAALIISWLWSVGIDSGVNAIGLSPAVVMQGQTVPPPARHWEEIALDGGNVTAIAFHPSDDQIVFAATTTGGVFRSTDAGQTWAERNSGLNKLSVIDLVINAQNGNELYAATREQVFKSTNGGASWTTILQDVDVRALALDPDNGASIYVATGDRLSEFGALYHSANGGQTWATLYQLRGTIFDVAVTKASDKVFIAFVPANAPFQGLPWVYATDTTAIDWQRACPIEDPERIYSCEVADLYVNPQEGDGVYAIYGQDIFKAANGIEWQSLGRLPLVVTPTRISSTSSGDIVYVGSETGIFKTSDGATWTSVDSNIGNLEIQTLATSPLRDGLLLAGTHGQGVLRSTTSGDSWANTSTGMRTPYINHLIIGGGGQTLYASGYRSGIFRSRDGGQTWSIRNSGLDYLGVTALAMHPTDQDILYLGTEVDYNQVLAYGIYKTTNGGDAWVRRSTGLPSDSHVLSIAVDPQAPTTLLAAFEDDRLYRSIDAGESWSQISAITLSHLVFHPTITNLVYGFTSYWDGIHRSTDGGVTWTQLGEHLTTVTGLSLAPDGGNGLWVGTDEGKLYHSDDSGATWVEHAIGVSAAVRAIAVNPANRQHLLVALGSEGVYESLDGGSVWTALNAGLRGRSAYGVLFDATDVYAPYAFDIGVFRLVTEDSSFTSPDGTTTFTFAPETFTQPVVMSFSRPAQTPLTGSLVSINHVYEVTPYVAHSNEVAQPRLPYTVTILYLDSDLNDVNEASLRLYYWNGTTWVLEPSSTVDVTHNTITARPNHFSIWAVLGERQSNTLAGMQILANPSWEDAEDPRTNNIWTWQAVTGVAGPDICHGWTYDSNDPSGPPAVGNRFLVTHRKAGTACLGFYQDVLRYPQQGETYTFEIAARAPTNQPEHARSFDLQLFAADEHGDLLVGERKSFSVAQNSWSRHRVSITIPGNSYRYLRAQVYLMSEDTQEINYNFDDAKLVGPQAYPVSGRVIKNNTGYGGVTVYTSINGMSRTVQSNSDGNYSIPYLSLGDHLIGVDDVDQSLFMPGSRPISVVDAPVTGQDFTASPLSTYQQILTNHSFEQAATQNWQWNGNCFRESVPLENTAGGVFHDQKVLVTHGGGGSNCVSFYQDVVRYPQPGETYTFEIASKAPTNSSAHTRNFDLQLFALGDNGKQPITQRQSFQVNQTAWTRHNVQIQINDSGYHTLRAEVYLMDNDLGAEIQYHFDHARLLGPKAYSISGRVIDRSGTPLSGVMVTTLVGGMSRGTVTTSNGEFTLPFMPNGTYTLVATKPGLTFTPASLPVTVQNGAVSGRIFTAESAGPGRSIAGRVFLSSSEPLSGARVRLLDSSGGVTQEMRTLEDGRFSFHDLSVGRYRLNTTMESHTFNPSSCPGAVVGNDCEVEMREAQIRQVYFTSNLKALNRTSPAASKWEIDYAGTTTGNSLRADGQETVTIRVQLRDDAGNYLPVVRLNQMLVSLMKTVFESLARFYRQINKEEPRSAWPRLRVFPRFRYLSVCCRMASSA